MAFRENKTTDELEALERLVASVLGLPHYGEPDEDLCGDCGVEEVPDEDVIDGPIDLDEKSLIEKAEMLCHDTLNNLLAGNIVLENASELIQTIQAVANMKTLKLSHKRVD